MQTDPIEGVPARHWHRARRRPHPVRRVPALLPAARRPAGPVLRARAPGRAAGADHLRPLVRLLHRPDREEAAQPLPARHAGAVVRHGRLQPDLQVLPELGHLQGARVRPPAGPSRARGDRRGGARRRLPLGRLHLQRPGDLPRVRRRRGAACRAARRQERRGHGRLRLPGARAPSSSRRWTPPMSISRRSPRASTGSSARARCSRCSTRWSTSSTRPTSGSRSRRS